MNIIIADDTEMHLTILTSTLKQVTEDSGIIFNIVGIAKDGAELVSVFENLSSSMNIDLIFSDIRMPEMDGISALVRILAINPDQKIIMVSSENLERMIALSSSSVTAAKDAADEAKKIQLLEKVADRVRKGVHEEGKVSSILEGCERLACDPIFVAKFMGAAGYIQKPYNLTRVRQTVELFQQNSEFAFVK